MPVTPTYPGVYVQELPSGVRTIVGVGTSTALFIGAARRGPLFKPIRCTSYEDFERNFSADTANVGDLPHYVKLFFLNGGSDAWVMRIADGAIKSAITLLSEAGIPVLTLEAKSAGTAGDLIRARVTYAGRQPESTFTMELFRYEVQGGRRMRRDVEMWPDLSMDASSPKYAPTFLTQHSKLVDAIVAASPAPIAGFSQSGRPVAHANNNSDFRAKWNALIGTNGKKRFQISVDGSPYLEVDLSGLDVSALTLATIKTATGLPKSIKDAIEARFTAAGLTGVTVAVSIQPGPTPTGPGTTASTLLRIASTGTGDVYVRPGSSDDLAVPLMFGTDQGGLEVGANAARRPTPNGISLRASDPTVLTALESLTQDELDAVTLEELPIPPGTALAARDVSVALQTTGAGDPWFADGSPPSLNGSSNGLREKLGLIADAINKEAEGNQLFFWTAEVAGDRLTISPTARADAPDDNMASTLFATRSVAAPPGTNIAAHFNRNVKYYSLGTAGLGHGQQVAGVAGNDGTAPIAANYDDAYRTVDREIDLFNILVLPPTTGGGTPVQSLYGPASVFCQKKRAFLLMDPPTSWTRADEATHPTSGVNSLRIGLAKDFAAIHFPRIQIDDRGTRKDIGPSGAIAGVMARIDGTRGVWKAAAGTEADLRGVVGLQYKLSDNENGILNPRAVNTIRVFPNGIVNWGARTMDGDDSFASEYKYVPIRRLALFIEESLYRGLKWVVFELNDEPLWAQIRLNVGAFMHDLFRKGAFQGATPREAYFVKCDKDTTTQNDRNLGIVNIICGFAPLKPAEFVILYLYLQQMAGQIEV
jgi:phage tail sheath protein FI